MRTLRHPLFLAGVLLFCLNQVLELTGIYIKPLFSYLDDLLCMPLVLTVILAAERSYFKDIRFVLPLPYVAVAVVLYSIFFEALLPFFSGRHRADGWDVVAYAAGAAAFQLILNKPLQQAKPAAE